MACPFLYRICGLCFYNRHPHGSHVSYRHKPRRTRSSSSSHERSGRMDGCLWCRRKCYSSIYNRHDSFEFGDWEFTTFVRNFPTDKVLFLELNPNLFFFVRLLAMMIILGLIWGFVPKKRKMTLADLWERKKKRIYLWRLSTLFIFFSSLLDCFRSWLMTFLAFCNLYIQYTCLCVLARLLVKKKIQWFTCMRMPSSLAGSDFSNQITWRRSDSAQWWWTIHLPRVQDRWATSKFESTMIWSHRSCTKEHTAKSVEIPQDIIDNVIAAVGYNTRLLKKCTLVSSSFLLPSRKQLFSRIYLRSDQTCQGIHQLLVQNPVIQSFVRTITLEHNVYFWFQIFRVDEWHIATCHSPTPVLLSGTFLDYCEPDCFESLELESF